jgi:hypothetical protein
MSRTGDWLRPRGERDHKGSHQHRGETPWPSTCCSSTTADLHERDGDLATAARLYAEAAQQASNLAERDHLTRQAARLNTGRRR